MPPAAISETKADRQSWADLWAAANDPWERTQDLADVLGVCRSAVQQYTSGARGGPWPSLRAALRATARRHPRAVPGLVQALARILLDARGTWVPDVDAGDLLGVHEEVADVTVACGRLLSAAREGASQAVIEHLTRELVREATEAGAAAREASVVDLQGGAA